MRHGRRTTCWLRYWRGTACGGDRQVRYGAARSEIAAMGCGVDAVRRERERGGGGGGARCGARERSDAVAWDVEALESREF